MNLKKKKLLSARTLKVGKKRIVFLKERLEEIKEAITKQDIKDLKKDGAIIIKEVKGRKKVKKRKSKRSKGNIRKKVKKRKSKYVTLTRKLRKYISELKEQGKVSKEEVSEIRKKIRNKIYRSKTHLKEQLGGSKK
ncbi:MAG: hypothetical protein KKF48_04600 [Nanoarchaeota archaeon]|nr:hypothetical protein [Nanoarchaeota archaeon]MBU1028296.1 hypothetical protein [Nanoarchaeota archaeon]